MKLHHHILHFILSPFGPCSLSLSLCCLSLPSPPPLHLPVMLYIREQILDSWRSTQWQQPLLHCSADKWVEIMPRHWQLISAKRRRLSAPRPTCPPAWYNWLPPAISVITNPNPNPKSAPALPLLPHLPDLHSLAKRERDGERGGRRATHNNPQHSHNRYLVIVVGLYALS